MTDNNEEEATELIENGQPEIESYTITVTRAFEVDITDRQLQRIVQQTGADFPEEALEQVNFQRERQNVDPEQKLLGVDVNVESSDSEDE